jgi:DNA/RNA-binding domain of Phe-tRNA-synthetase-like protein
MTEFIYHPDILRTFPELRAGIIFAENLENNKSGEMLQQVYTKQQQATLHEIGENPISEIEAITAWRSAFRKFGVNPTKYRCAPEALLRRLTKKGDIPFVNKIVDCCNLVSIKYKIAAAAFDTKAITGALTVRFSNGDERYTPLGESAVQTPERGEVIFADETGLVTARRWCWRQSNDSAVSIGTRQTIITVEGQHLDCEDDVKIAAGDLLKILTEYVGGKYFFEMLGPEEPRFSY